MNLRLSRYKFNAKIISDDPKLNVPHIHPLYTFSIHVCVSASFLLVFPIFSYSLRKSQPNMTVVIRVSREARRVAEGRRSSLACTDECRLDREIQREKVELGCVLERESRTLLERVGDDGRRKREGEREGSTVEQTRYDRSVLQQAAGGSPYIDEFFCSLHHHTHAFCLLSSSASLYLSPSLTLGLRHSQSLGFFSSQLFARITFFLTTILSFHLRLIR